MNCVKPETKCKYQLPCNPGECSTNVCQKTLDNIEEGINVLIALQQPANNSVNSLPDNIIPAKKAKK